MQQTVRRFNIITLRPHWGQYIISQGFMFLVSLVLFLVAGHDAITFKMPFLVLGTVTMLMTLYGCLYLSKLQYVISAEQLIVQQGVFHRTSDYIELYRIVDFSEQRDILEQFFGLKTISIYSGDRTNPKLDICGVQEKVDVVGIIRERVEYNKQIKGVYEITNRY
jgi:uncharacterized membrane protein YdbT with pleckstrin-like domain